MNIFPRFDIEDDDCELLGQFTAWMEKVVTNAGIDYQRRQRHRRFEFTLDQSAIETLGYEDPFPVSNTEFELEGKLSEAFNNLTPLRRQILTLIFVERLSAQETADRLGCSVNYVYVQKHRTLKALRDYLMEGGVHCGD